MTSDPLSVLVSGGAGFLGTHVAKALLARGHRVRILDSLDPSSHGGRLPELPPGAEFVRGDVRRWDDWSDALHGIDAVVHLAAARGIHGSALETNVVGTANLLDVLRARRQTLRKLVVASSSLVYGDGSCASEGSPADPRTPHAVSKYAQERLVLCFGAETGTPATALRYFWVYGPRQPLDDALSRGALSLLRGAAPALPDGGRQTIDLLFVEDAAEATAVALESDAVNGKAVNVGSGRGVALRAAMDALGRILGGPPAESRGELPATEPRHLVADVSALEALGFRPRVPLEEGLARTAEWIRSCDRIMESRGGWEPEVHVASPAVDSADPTLGRDSLSVIIPAYNEAGNMESLVTYILDEVPRMVPAFEVIIVSDGSHDGTSQIADRLQARDRRVRAFHHPFNLGYGAGQKTGVREARGEWLTFVPADHQFDVRDLRLYLPLRESHDIIVGRRMDRQDPFVRSVISWCFNRTMRLLYGLEVKDINWVKMFRRSLFERIPIQSWGFAVDAEIMVKAHYLGLKIAEVRVPHYPRTWGVTTTVRFRSMTKTAFELLAIRKHLKALRKDEQRRITEIAKAPVGPP